MTTTKHDAIMCLQPNQLMSTTQLPHEEVNGMSENAKKIAELMEKLPEQQQVLVLATVNGMAMASAANNATDHTV